MLVKFWPEQMVMTLVSFMTAIETAVWQAAVPLVKPRLFSPSCSI